MIEVFTYFDGQSGIEIVRETPVLAQSPYSVASKQKRVLRDALTSSECKQPEIEGGESKVKK